MGTPHAFLLPGLLVLIACGGATTATARQPDDASISTVPEASSITEAATCGSPAVSNVVQGGVSDVPSAGCSGFDAATAPTCEGPPVTFSCPLVQGPGDAGTIRPGDEISVSVVAASDGLVNYPCFGLVADHGVMGGATLLYALPATGWVFSTQIPPSLAPGTVVHFTAYVRSASPLNAGPCPNRLGRLDFDVTVD